MLAVLGNYIRNIDTGEGMSKARGGSGTRERGGKAGTGDWRHVLSAGALIAAVAGTLILAAVLRTGTEAVRPRAGHVAPELPEPGSTGDAVPARPAVPSPAVEASPDRTVRPRQRPPADALLLRTARDRERLASRPADWTLQFARFCQREHAERILADLASREDLYLVERDGCYLVCWGVYGSADLARTAGNVPPALAELPGGPFPKRVEEALR